MEGWIALVLVVMALVAALVTLFVRNFVAAVASVSVVSLAVAVLFALLRAPDVAMTEAAVGAGLSAIVLALGLKRLGLARVDSDSGHRDA
ncbi:MAG: DUF4040 domain-containing protein [Chromatiales bacterium]|nr:DUF4040 domain-containing protein [Chromatiales bacterium]